MNSRVDEAAFSDVFNEHGSAVAYLACRLVGPHEQDDFVQEVFLHAWRRWHTYDSTRGSVRVWLVAIAFDKARKFWRRPRALDFQIGSDIDVDTRIDVAAALRQLPRKQRLAVELHYFVDLSIRDCAKLMRCSEGTVKSNLHDARMNLKKVLELG